MANQILISVSPWDSRVALVEQGRLAELYLERRQQPDPTTNIYKGRVVKVLPGMDAAFVDIGLERHAYLYAEEVSEQWDSFFSFWLEAEGAEAPKILASATAHAPIEDLLQEGQELMVQICRPPMGGKGARLTTHITLPGHYLVYTPTLPQMGVSRRITEQAERHRLLSLLEKLKPKDGGLIARTASQGQSEEVLRRERDVLVNLWQTILRKRESSLCPALLYAELDFPRRMVRELCGPEVDRLVIDDASTGEQIREYVSGLDPRLENRVEIYSGPEPLFAHFGLDTDWRRLLTPKVWLKSGGYLVITATEALTAVDVNTGRFIGRRHWEDTILRTNLEAAQEVARQVRLRNIGGLIVIDFIDMKKAAHRDVVYRTLMDALKPDRAKTSALPISSLGLLEMTRERLRASLADMVTDLCRCCAGKGFQLSCLVIAHDILRQLAWDAREFPGCRFIVNAHPEVGALVAREGDEAWNRVAREFHCDLKIVEEPGFPPEKYEIIRELRPTPT
jgi:ribonuclease G